MDRKTRALALNDAKFKEIFGGKKDVFQKMLHILTLDREDRRKKGGPRPKLSPADQLILTLQYWREYRTMEHIAYEFGVSKSTVCNTIIRVENVLIQDEQFHLSAKKALISKKNVGRTMAVDVTESPIERPKKNKKLVFREKKAAYDKNANRY